MTNNRKTILAQWKRKRTGDTDETYTSFAAFLSHNKTFNKDKNAIEYHIFRLKKPFENDKIKLSRVSRISKKK